MAATVRVSYYGASGSEPAGVTAESGMKFNREDTLSGTTPVPIPTATGTKYSWYKQLALEVTGTAATTLSNYTIKMASAATTGLYLYFKLGATYVQAAVGNMPADGGTNGAVPSGYTAMTTSAQQWDAGGDSASTTGRKGDFCLGLLGVGYDYAGGGGSAIALPNLTVTYDEA